MNEPKAIIVDDEEEIGLMVCKILSKQNIKATSFNTVESARQQLSDNDFDLFFLDLNLPDGTGFDLIPAIREKTPEAKIIIISAYDGIAEVARATELQIDDFIKKPFSRADIINAVQS